MQIVKKEMSEYGHEVYTIDSECTGSSLLIFGGVHGNEPCGGFAIREIVALFEKGELFLTCGSLTLIPNCNVQADLENKRQVKFNLNRIFGQEHSKYDDIEHKYASFLSAYIDRTDYFLDIHSTSADNGLFVCDDIASHTTQSWAKAIGFPYIIQGWPGLYDETDSMDTLMYAASKGKTGIMIECGQHLDPNAIGRAKAAIVNSLTFLDLIRNERISLDTVTTELVKLDNVVYRENCDVIFAKQWKNFDFINRGDVILQDENGNAVLIASENCFIVLPNIEARLGDEWFYIGRVG